MNEKRLREIERRLGTEGTFRGATGELIAEIRRLRGVNDKRFWEILALAGDPRQPDKWRDLASELVAYVVTLRGMVDELLVVSPLKTVALHTDEGYEKECQYCRWTSYDSETDKHYDDCPYQRVEQVRDWVHDGPDQ